MRHPFAPRSPGKWIKWSKNSCSCAAGGKIFSAQERCTRPKCKSIVAKHSAIAPIVLLLSGLGKHFPTQLFIRINYCDSPVRPSIRQIHTQVFAGLIPLFNVGVVLGQGFFVVVRSPRRGNIEILRGSGWAGWSVCTGLHNSPAALIGFHFTF